MGSTMTTRVIIAGGRNYCNPKYYPDTQEGKAQCIKDKQKAFRQLTALCWGYSTGKKDAPSRYEGLIILTGCAPGADGVGEEFALGNGIPLERYPADWDKYKKKAGPIRNEQMGDVADRAIVFWDGESRGSKHMIDYAREKKLIVRVIRYGNGEVS